MIFIFKIKHLLFNYNFFKLKRGFEESTLGTVFANAYFGNSVIAILAGVLAQYAANTFGYV